MAKITFILRDEGDGVVLTFIPEPDFDGDSDDLTGAQAAAMDAMAAIIDDVEIEDAHDVQ